MKRSTKLWIALGVAFGILQALYLIGKEIWFKQYRIVARSMAPTLVKGDRTFVRRTKEIARGDLAVYRLPDKGAPFIHRAIAVGGDTIEIRDQQVLLNGKEQVEPYAKYDPDAERSNFGPYTVPAGHIFVLGDNRDNANDSRYHGTVPKERILGRVIYVFSPSRMMQ